MESNNYILYIQQAYSLVHILLDCNFFRFKNSYTEMRNKLFCGFITFNVISLFTYFFVRREARLRSQCDVSHRFLPNE